MNPEIEELIAREKRAAIERKKAQERQKARGEKKAEEVAEKGMTSFHKIQQHIYALIFLLLGLAFLGFSFLGFETGQEEFIDFLPELLAGILGVLIYILVALSSLYYSFYLYKNLQSAISLGYETVHEFKRELKEAKKNGFNSAQEMNEHFKMLEEARIAEEKKKEDAKKREKRKKEAAKRRKAEDKRKRQINTLRELYGDNIANAFAAERIAIGMPIRYVQAIWGTGYDQKRSFSEGGETIKEKFGRYHKKDGRSGKINYSKRYFKLEVKFKKNEYGDWIVTSFRDL